MRKLVFIAAISGATMQVRGQNNTSPYSMIGIGDIEKSSFDRSSGLGHAGLALSSSRFLFNANPASLATLDEHFFYLELSSRFRSVNYYGTAITDPTQNNSSDIQFKKLSLAIKLRPRWAVSVGLTPFSTSNYSFYGKKSIQGSNETANAYYDGSGSTNQFYITNSFAISKNLSVGLQSSYLFGQMQETETLSMSATDSVLGTRRNIFIGSTYFKLGAHYRTRLGKQWELSAGAVASNKKTLRNDYSLQVTDGNTVLLNEEYYKTRYFTLPAMYGAGIAATYRNAYTIAGDYHFEGWSSQHITGLSYALVNSQRWSVGGEYSKKLNYRGQAFEQYFLQAGLFYNNSYLKVYGQQLKDYGATIGAGMQLSRSGLGIQGSLEFGKRGTTDLGLIKENYTQFNFTFSYRDFWFTRVKRYD